MMIIKYVNHYGEIVNLNSNGLMCGVDALTAWKSAGGANSADLSLVRDEFELIVAAYSNEARKRLYEVPAKDVDKMVPGRLYVNDWYLSCYITASSQQYSVGTKSLYSVHISPQDPYWRFDYTSTIRNEQKPQEFLDFPYGFEFDYGYSASISKVRNSGIFDADVLIRMYGPIEDPSIVIAGNKYEVGVDLPAGSRVEIDTMNRTIRTYSSTGVVENAFKDAKGEYTDGSGSYIFQRVAPGTHDVIWSGEFNVDVVLTERSRELELWRI